MVKLDKQTWKENYFTKLQGYVEQFSQIMVVGVENVRSKQMQQIRSELRGKAELLMGKNTMMRKCLRDMVEDKPWIEELLPMVVGNIGFVFTDMDLGECRKVLTENKVQAPAKAGIIAPVDVWLEDGPTGMGPEKTSFFQALNLPTKIAKGMIQLQNRVHLIKVGDKVGISEAKLLNMLNVSPFFYNIEPVAVMQNGSVFPIAVLDIKPETILAKFAEGIAKVASVSLAISYPTKASAPHLIVNGFKNVIAVALATDITFNKPTPGLENAKLFLSDPEAFAAANAGSGGGGGGGGDAPAEEKKEAAPAPAEEEEESDEDGDFSLFD